MNFFKTTVATIAFATLSCGLGFAEPITIKFSHIVAPTGHPKGEAVGYFKKLVEERLAGKVELEVYPSGSLFGDNKVLEAMQLGDVQLAAPSMSKFERFSKAFRVFDLPFLFANEKQIDRFQAGEKGQKILGELEKSGLKGLAYWSLGMKQISANRPLLTPKDAKGLKFRVQPAAVIEAQMRAIGANPQKLAYSEAYNALQTGVVDGQENTWANIWGSKFFEVQDGITDSNHGLIGYVLVASTEFWSSLPDDVRAEMEAIIAEVTIYERDLAQRMNNEAREKIIAAGGTVRTLTPEQRAEWAAAMKPVWDEFSAEIGADVIAAASSN